MADTFNEELFDSMLRHQIGLQRYGSSVRNQIWALLDATEADLKRQIANAGAIGLDTPARVARLNRLLAKLKESRLVGWREARKVWFEEMRALSVAEAGFFDRIIIAAVPGVELGTLLPDPARLRNIVTSKPFMGKTLKGWADNVQRADLSRIEDQIKIGLVQNESPQQISRRIVGTVNQRGRDGVTQITRRNATAITRTVTNGVASEARRIYAELNKEIAPDEVFTATLDTRTTPICRSLDGKQYKVGTGPQLPLHIGERSLYSPVIDGEVIGVRPRRDFTQQKLVREFSKSRGIDVKTPRGQTAKAARAAIPRGHRGDFDKWSRKRMRELTGSTPAKTTYQQWLGGQSAGFQNEILGPTRGKLFRKGGLKLDKFVELDGTELTLAQLATRNTDAFLRAGLDPALFR